MNIPLNVLVEVLMESMLTGYTSDVQLVTSGKDLPPDELLLPKDTARKMKIMNGRTCGILK